MRSPGSTRSAARASAALPSWELLRRAAPLDEAPPIPSRCCCWRSPRAGKVQAQVALERALGPGDVEPTGELARLLRDE